MSVFQSTDVHGLVISVCLCDIALKDRVDNAADFSNNKTLCYRRYKPMNPSKAPTPLLPRISISYVKDSLFKEGPVARTTRGAKLYSTLPQFARVQRAARATDIILRNRISTRCNTIDAVAS